MSEDRLQTLAYEERNVGKPGRCVKEKVLAVAVHAIHVFVDFVSIRITFKTRKSIQLGRSIV